jgi:dephospho-CoA kinase
MFLVGLTGGIAAGKSTVAEHWERLGAAHVDADELARRVVSSGTPAAAEIRSAFGDHVFDSAGNLDRAAMAAVVFAEPGKRKELEAIVHPAIQAAARAEIDRLSGTLPAAALVVYSIPLLVETASQLPFDAVVTVEAPRDKQIERMVKSRGWTQEDAARRIDAQATPIERAARADHILSSNQELGLLLRDAEQLYHLLATEAQRKAATIGLAEGR